MSDEGTAATAVPATGTDSGAATNGSTDQNATAAEQFYAGTYKTRDEAEKGIREAQLTVNRAFAERDKLMAKVNELTATLQKAVEGRTPERQPPVIDRAALAKEVDERGGQGVLDVLERFAKETDAEYDRRLAEVNRKAEERIAQLEKMMRDRDPEYLTHREKVVEMAERMGLDPDQNRDLLMKVVKELNRNAVPGRPDIPGITSAQNVARPAAGPTIDPTILKAMEANEYVGKLTPDEIAKLAAKNAETADRIKRVVRHE